MTHHRPDWLRQHREPILHAKPPSSPFSNRATTVHRLRLRSNLRCPQRGVGDSRRMQRLSRWIAVLQAPMKYGFAGSAHLRPGAKGVGACHCCRRSAPESASSMPGCDAFSTGVLGAISCSTCSTAATGRRSLCAATSSAMTTSSSVFSATFTTESSPRAHSGRTSQHGDHSPNGLRLTGTGSSTSVQEPVR